VLARTEAPLYRRSRAFRSLACLEWCADIRFGRDAVSTRHNHLFRAEHLAANIAAILRMACGQMRVPWMLGTGMNVRKLGTICALLAATPNLIGCESSRDSPDRQFQKQVNEPRNVASCRTSLSAINPSRLSALKR
jgi:hypothetical protein